MITRNVDICSVDDNDIQLYLAQGLADESWVDTRMLFLDSETARGYHEVHSRIVSVDSKKSEFRVAALAMNGIVSVATRNGISFHQIEGPGTGSDKFGYAKRIRFIGNSLFVCGDMRQVYRLESDQWRRLDIGLREEDPRQVGCSLNDVAGVSEESIYAVGDRGRVFYYDSDKWRECPSATNASLERVLVDESDCVWISGANGTLMYGSGNRWDIANFDGAPNQTFWGIARYVGETYVCSSQGLYKYHPDGLKLVQTTDVLGSPFRLAANEKYLWVMAPDRLVRYDGTVWQDISF